MLEQAIEKLAQAVSDCEKLRYPSPPAARGQGKDSRFKGVRIQGLRFSVEGLELSRTV